MIDAGNRNAAIAYGLRQHTESSQIGDIDDDDDVSAPERGDRFRGPVNARKIVEQETKPGGSRRWVGNCDIVPRSSQQVREPGFAAETVAVGIHMCGQTDSLAGTESSGEV